MIGELESLIKESDYMYEAGLNCFKNNYFYAGQYMVEAVNARYNYLSKQSLPMNVKSHLFVNKVFLEAHLSLYKYLGRR